MYNNTRARRYWCIFSKTTPIPRTASECGGGGGSPLPPYLFHVVADLGRRGRVIVLLEELLRHTRFIDARFLLNGQKGRKGQKYREKSVCTEKNPTCVQQTKNQQRFATRST